MSVFVLEDALSACVCLVICLSLKAGARRMVRLEECAVIDVQRKIVGLNA